MAVLFVVLAIGALLQLRGASSAAIAPKVQRLISSPSDLYGLGYDSHSAALWSYFDGQWTHLEELTAGEWMGVAGEQELLLVSVSGETRQRVNGIWTKSQIPLADGVWIQAIVSLDHGYRAYSIAHSDTDRVFQSEDGLTWHPTSAPSLRYLDAVALENDASAVYMEGDGQSAVGFHSESSWTLHSFEPINPNHVFAMASNDDALLVAGTDEQGTAIWLGPPLSPLVRFGVPIQNVVAAIGLDEDNWIVVGGRSEHASSWSINSTGDWHEIHIDFATRFIDVVQQNEQVVALVESPTGHFVVCLEETWLRC